MKRMAYIVLTLLVMSMFIVGCGYKDISVKKEGEKIIKMTDESKYQKGDDKSLKKYFGLNPDDYKEVSIYVPSSSMEASEMLIIKVKDQTQVDTIETAIDSRIQKQSDGFKDYAPEQYGLLQNYEISTRGNYVFYVVGKDAYDMKKEFKKSIS